MCKQTYVCKVCKKRGGTSKYVCKVCYNMWSEPFCILDVGVDGFKPKSCPYNTGHVEAEWELIED
jgi:hypothetical protein